MEIYTKEINKKWIKAAILGSIWASFEIVFGSFLHNIKFPMSGTILTVVAIIILITFTQKWKENGIIIRAGLIAALMKSISPSAVLLGPMTGILFEAIIVEFTIYIFGKNYFSYILSGIFALYSVLIHKILSLIILYGLDFIKISKNLYYFLIKQLKIDDISFLKAILLISIFYILAGIFAAFLGIFIGEKALKNETNFEEKVNINDFKTNFFEVNKTQKFSSILLIINFTFIIFAFIVINNSNIILSSIIAFSYLIFCFFRYSNSLKHFKKIGFWIQISIILIISILFFNINQSISIFNKEGLFAGISMILRMFILLSGFSALSVELRNPLVKTMLFNQGLGNLYQAVGMAFSFLPALIEQNNKAKEILKNPLFFLTKTINTADYIYKFYLDKNPSRRVIFISGEKNQGKTTFFENLAKNLIINKINIAGFVALGIFKNNEKTDFYIKNINSDEKIHLASVNKISDIKIGKFYFDKKAFEFGEKIINSNVNNSNIFFIDEIGQLEIKNKGWFDIIENLFTYSSKLQIWTVRKNLIKKIIHKFAINHAIIFDIDKDNIDNVAAQIMEYISKE